MKIQIKSVAGWGAHVRSRKEEDGYTLMSVKRVTEDFTEGLFNTLKSIGFKQIVKVNGNEFSSLWSSDQHLGLRDIEFRGVTSGKNKKLLIIKDVFVRTAKQSPSAKLTKIADSTGSKRSIRIVNDSNGKVSLTEEGVESYSKYLEGIRKKLQAYLHKGMANVGRIKAATAATSKALDEAFKMLEANGFVLLMRTVGWTTIRGKKLKHYCYQYVRENKFDQKIDVFYSGHQPKDSRDLLLRIEYEVNTTSVAYTPEVLLDISKTRLKGFGWKPARPGDMDEIIPLDTGHIVWDTKEDAAKYIPFAKSMPAKLKTLLTKMDAAHAKK